jgi:ABC-type multidrug transport system fused ATPase/permease subunit
MLRTFCRCLDLRWGSLIIGIFSLANAVMGILNTTYSLIAGPEKSFFYTIFRSARHTDEILTYVTWAALAVNLLFFFICCFMIHGVRKEKRLLLIPWVIWSCLYIAFLVFAVVIIFIAGTGEWRLLLVALFLVIFISAWIYLTLVVVSYYQALRDGYALDQPSLPVWHPKDHY